MTQTFSMDEVPAHFIHAFKEGAMQRFFRGSTILDGYADIPPGCVDDDEAGTVVFLKDTESRKADSLRHHICFILPASAAQLVVSNSARAALQHAPQDMFTGNLEAHCFLRRNVLREGEFNMVASWEGVGKKAFKLHRRVASSVGCMSLLASMQVSNIMVWRCCSV